MYVLFNSKSLDRGLSILLIFYNPRNSVWYHCHSLLYLNFIDFCSNFYYSFLSLYLDLMNSSSLDPQDGYRAFFFFNTHVLAAAFYSADFVVCFPFHLLQLLFVCFYWYFSFEQCIFGSVLFNLQVWEDFFFMLPVCWFSVKFKCLKAGIVWFVLF